MAKRKTVARTSTSKSPSTSSASLPFPHHPRPLLTRPDTTWQSLDGPWSFAIDKAGAFSHPSQASFDRTITVPFAPETPLSGIHDTSLYHAVWYQRTVTPPKLAEGERLLLHFGAVDYLANVFINGNPVATHEGGYSPFHADITEYARTANQSGTPLVISVHAIDDPHDMAKPRGKQDWLETKHAFWYDRTTGIWQSVWLETLPATAITSLRWTPDALTFNVAFEATLSGPVSEDTVLSVTLLHEGKYLTTATFSPIANSTTISGTLNLNDPGLPDARNALLWWPWRPNLITADLLLQNGQDVVDAVSSYTALRHLRIQNGRFWINNSPQRLDLALDQGYWEESGLTAPSDDALRKDVELIKAMGLNGVRKHQKLEHPRWLYWADRLGVMLWSEFPACYKFSEQAVRRTTQQWMEAVQRDVSHPCIIAWVPFNESWGVPDLPDSAPQRALCDALYHLTKAFDPTRPVIGNDGWELPLTDIFGVHDYDSNPEAIKARYQSPAHFQHHERPGGKLLSLPGYDHSKLPLMLTEFGGIAFSRDTGGTWGYSRAKSSDDLAARYSRLLEAVRSLPLVAGFCYTQLTDTYQEANGLLFMNRTPKFPLDLMSIATRGPRNDDERAKLQTAIAKLSSPKPSKPK